MSDPILTTRLNALDGELRRAIDTTWLRRAGIGPEDIREQMWTTLEVSEQMWTTLEVTIGRQAKQLGQRIAGIRKDLKDAPHSEDPAGEVAKAWRSYASVNRASQRLFRELLEFIGGLTFRAKGQEYEQICRLADELVRTCMDQTIGGAWQWVSVPSVEEAVTKTWARMVRLRFPEQTIWTLPFTAHEFGHVIMDEDDAMRQLVEDQAATWIDKAAVEFHDDGSGGAADGKEERSRAYISELCSDAFATYYMGPAYACAAIHERLDPAAVRARAEHPSDLARADVVLTTLERMDERAMGKPYADIIERLRSDWKEICDRTAPGSDLEKSLKDSLDKLVDRVLESFELLRNTAEFPAEGTDGWSVALEWHKGWATDLQKQLSVGLPDVSRDSSLRDALNAAWNFRLEDPEHARDVKDAALRLCLKIIEAKRTRAASGPTPGS